MTPTVIDFPITYPSVNSLQKVILLWFIEGKQSTEKPGGAHCGESRMMRFEWEAKEVIPWSTPNFVWKYGENVIELLAPQPEEIILDLGCGTGQLTNKIADSGAKVIGIDRSEEMIIKARENYPQIKFMVADATDFQVEQPLDAVFSNATLHWVKQPEAAINCIQKALKPRGRFVAEFGGKGNVRQIVQALTEALVNSGYNLPVAANPWYFPSIGEYTSLLEKYNLEVTYAHLFDRLTALEASDGLANWLSMFAGSFLSELSQEQEHRIIEQVIAKLKPTLYSDGIWKVDYRRIRIVAIKNLI